MTSESAPVPTLTGPVADAPLPTRRELVSEAAPSRQLRGLRTAVTDTYTTVLQIVIAVGLLLGVSGRLRRVLLDSSAGGWVGGPVVEEALLAGALAACLLLLGLGMLARLGPIGMDAPRTLWWLSLPVDRGELLRPVLARRVLAGALTGGVIGLLTGFVAPAATLGPATVLLLGALGGALVGIAGVLLLSLVAVRSGSAATSRVGTVLDLLALVLVVGLAAAAIGRVREVPAAAGLAVVGVVVVLALVGTVVLGLRVPTRVGETGVATLRTAAARLGRASGSILQVDIREFGRAVAAEPSTRPRPRSRRLGWVRGPETAVLAADLLLLRRQPRRLITAGALVLLPFVLVAGTDPHRAVAAVLLWLLGYAAATTLSEPARGQALAPAASRAFGVSTASLPLVRLAPVAVLMTVWGAVALPLVAWPVGVAGGMSPGGHGGVLRWALLGALAGIGWAAAALRGAVRPDPDLSQPAVVTAMGTVPPGAVAAISSGPDLALLATVPVLLALLARSVPGELLLGQLVVTIVAVAIGWGYAAHRNSVTR